MTLNPCPFCGGEAEFEARRDLSARAVCVSCGARSRISSTSEAAVAAWNTRADQPSTLRDDIARDVLRSTFPQILNTSLTTERLNTAAELAYTMADAMMKARS